MPAATPVVRPDCRNYGKKKMKTASLIAVCIVCVLGLVFAVHAAGQQPAITSADEVYRPTATVKQIMDSMVAPTAQVLWDSVGTVATAQGVVTSEPKTDEDWANLRHNAVVLAEAMNSLMIPGRIADKPGAPAGPGSLAPGQITALIQKDQTAWIAHAHEFETIVQDLIKAIDTKNVEGISDGGGTLYEACENCHLQFWYPNQDDVQK